MQQQYVCGWHRGFEKKLWQTLGCCWGNHAPTGGNLKSVSWTDKKSPAMLISKKEVFIMRILLKILLFPITLVLSVIVLICQFLCAFSSMLLSVLAFTYESFPGQTGQLQWKMGAKRTDSPETLHQTTPVTCTDRSRWLEKAGYWQHIRKTYE